MINEMSMVGERGDRMECIGQKYTVCKLFWVTGIGMFILASSQFINAWFENHPGVAQSSLTLGALMSAIGALLALLSVALRRVKIIVDEIGIRKLRPLFHSGSIKWQDVSAVDLSKSGSLVIQHVTGRMELNIATFDRPILMVEMVRNLVGRDARVDSALDVIGLSTIALDNCTNPETEGSGDDEIVVRQTRGAFFLMLVCLSVAVYSLLVLLVNGHMGSPFTIFFGVLLVSSVLLFLYSRALHRAVYIIDNAGIWDFSSNSPVTLIKWGEISAVNSEGSGTSDTIRVHHVEGLVEMSFSSSEISETVVRMISKMVDPEKVDPGIFRLIKKKVVRPEN